MNNSVLNNEQDFSAGVKPRQERRDTQTVVMIGAPRSFQFRMNSRSSSIFTCWMSLLRFSSDVPDSGNYTAEVKNQDVVLRDLDHIS